MHPEVFRVSGGDEKALPVLVQPLRPSESPRAQLVPVRPSSHGFGIRGESNPWVLNLQTKWTDLSVDERGEIFCLGGGAVSSGLWEVSQQAGLP